jgi:hypothetical protein
MVQLLLLLLFRSIIIIIINVTEFGTTVFQLYVDYTYITSNWNIIVSDEMKMMSK